MAIQPDLNQDDAIPTSSGPSIFQVLWRRKIYVIFGIVVGIALGVLQYLQKTPQYQSSAQVYVMKRRGDPLPTTTGTDTRVAFVEDYVATQEALIKSTEVLKEAARVLEKSPLTYPPANRDYLGHIAIGLGVSRLKEVSTGLNSNVINLTYRGASPEDCAVVLESLIKGYQDSLSMAVQGVTKETLEQIIKAQGEIERQLKETEQKYRDINKDIRERSSLPVEDIKASINRNEMKKADLELRKIETQTRLTLIKKAIDEKRDRKDVLALFALSATNKNDVGGIGQAAAESRTMEDVLFNLQLQEEELLQSRGKDHPDVIAIRARAAKTKEFLEKRVAKTGAEAKKALSPDDNLDLYIQVLQQDLEGNDLQQQLLDDLLKKDRAKIANLDSALVDEKLTRETMDRQRKTSDFLAERRQQIELNKDAPLYDARVITPPNMGAKVSPVLYQSLALGGFLGLLLGGGLAYLAEMSDKSFRSVDEIRSRLGMSVIGQIPPLTKAEVVKAGDENLDRLLVAHHKPKSIEAEAYRGIRTSLYFSTRGKGHQVIQVTSPAQGDGKSTLISNLAIAIAQSNKKVILVDADFRRPRVEKIFGIQDEENGLASVINEETLLEDAIQRSIIPNLDILPRGPRPGNPAELLTSSRFQEVLEQIKLKYDIVLIDTPPLLAVSDPAVVAPRVDGVILAVQLSKNDRPMVERARDILQTLGANLVGVVVNNVDYRKEGSGYTYGYGYGYGYGYLDSEQEIDLDSEEKANRKRKAKAK